jgi:hypothetical protein
MQVAAVEKALEDVSLHGAPDAARGTQLAEMALRTLPQRTVARVAWAIHRRLAGHTPENGAARAPAERNHRPDGIANRRSTPAQ